MKPRILAAIAAAVLSACGGGGNDGSTKIDIAAVKVVGASLADSGTFGAKFTVQPTSGSPAYLVYPERIAATYGTSVCNAYSSANMVAYTANAGCTNYAVGGARINYTSGSTQVESLPLSAIKQLVDAGAAGYGSNDLLIVGEAGANDAATLVTAYLATALSGTSDFSTLVLTLVPPATVQANATNPPALGTLYMQALADKLVAAVKTNALDKGATRIAILNTLDVTKTPRFQAALAQVSAATTPAQAAALQQMAQAWILAFNARLETAVAPYSSNIVVVDFYTNFNNEMADPAQYGLTTVTATVCDQIITTGTAPGATTFSNTATIAACTDSAASAITPTVAADGTSSWWKKYLFADNFHPTPYGHQLIAQMVAKRLTEAGWL